MGCQLCHEYTYQPHPKVKHTLHCQHSCTGVMAFFRRRDVGQAFRNNRELQQFVLTDVTPTGRILGTGSFGSVEEVNKY